MRLLMSNKLHVFSNHFFPWLVANVLGFTAIGILILLFPSVITISGFFVTTFIIGIPVSFAQWIALRRILRTSILWTMTIPVAIPLGFFVIRVIPEVIFPLKDDDSIAALTIIFLIIGLIIGLVQWFILRKVLSKSYFWVLGSSVGIGVSFWAIMVTELINQSTVLSYAVIALVYSIITGIVLSGLIRYQGQSTNAIENTN